MATPILTLSAAWAGVPPIVIAIMAIAGRKIFTSFITFISFFFWGLALQSRADKPKSLTTTTTRKRLLPSRFLSRILVVNLERKFTGVDPFGGAPCRATTHFAG